MDGKTGWGSGRLIAAGVALSICWLLAHAGPASGQEEGRSPGEINAYADAANAQNEQAFELAVELWREYLTKYPQSPKGHDARHYLGVCLLQLDPPKYAEAAKAFEAIVAKADEKAGFSLNEDAFLNLGWCRYSLAGQAQDEAEATKLFDQAAQTFASLVKKYPESKHADQALFYQGEALYQQGKKQEAAAAYKQVVEKYPDSKQRTDALYALGVTYEELGQYPQAGSIYDIFLKEAGESPLATEVRMRKGETMLQAALAAEQQDQGEEAKQQFTAAKKALGEAAAVEGFASADHALFRQAFAAAKLGEFSLAGDIYAKIIAEHDGSSYVADSQIRAGRNYYLAEKFDDAAKWLQAVYDGGGENAPEAAHWLCQIHLKKKQPAEAEKLAAAAAAKAEGSSYFVQLKLDRADALYAMQGRQGESLPLYLAIAEEHPEHSLAPQALYNAAFTALELKKYDEATQYAAAFQEKYPQHILLPDVVQVASESELLNKDFAKAEARYRGLLKANPTHPDAESWRVRLGQAIYLQGKYEETIEEIETHLASIKSSAATAEAQHLIGASRFAQKDYAAAETALAASLEADSGWRQADETLLMLSQAKHKQGQTDAAIADAQKLLASYPESRLLDQAHYRLAEYHYAKGDYLKAEDEYDTVITSSPDSIYVPYSYYNKGWAQLKDKEYTSAIDTFTALIDKFAEHALVSDARFARGMCRRQEKMYAEAISDFDVFLKAEQDAGERAGALYEKGLAQVALKDNESAVATFVALLKETPDYSAADKVQYELGWAYRNLGQPDEAVAAFAALGKSHPNSPLAAEAHFHVGEDLYTKEKYAEAAAEYEAAKDKAGDSPLGEKAIYKLGWANYKQDAYQPALSQFDEQMKKYPDGALHTDGLFMQGECLFKLEQYEKALPAFLAADKAAAESESVPEQVKVLIKLHGGQSAAQQDKWQQSLDLLAPIPAQFAESFYVAEANYEIGRAQEKLGNSQEAMDAYEKAAVSRTVVGARARFMLGELEFSAKKYDDAIKNFQRVMYGFGGDKSPDEIKPWQAKSAFEAARCAEVQIQAAEGGRRRELIADAIKFYSHVVEKLPGADPQLTAQAKTRIVELNKL